MKRLITPAEFTFIPETKFERKILEHLSAILCDEMPITEPAKACGMPNKCPDCGSTDIECGEGKSKCNICQREF